MPKINMTKFCNDVKKAKEGLGLTQRQLEAQTGLGHSAISRLMNGHMKRPTYKTVNTLCAALGLEREDYDPANLSDVEKTHEEAKATLARANAMLDDAQHKLYAIKAKLTEDTPEAVANDLAEERLAALEEAHARIKELEAENAALTAESPDEGVEPDVAVPGQGMTHEQQIEELLAAIDHINESLNRVTIERDAATKEQKETELELANAENEIAELKNALDIKNRSIAEKSRRIDDLTVKLRDSDTLVFALLEFVNRLKDGDVER